MNNLFHNIDLSSIGQQLLWTEQSTAGNLDSIVWPRAAVSAEVALTFCKKFIFSLILCLANRSFGRELIFPMANHEA